MSKVGAPPGSSDKEENTTFVSCQLHVHRWGQSGPLVLALHSSGLSGLQWRRLSEKVSSEHRLLAPDFLGYGASPHSPNGIDFTYQEDLQEVISLLDELDEPVILLGHSYGGFVALKAALARPRLVETLALYEPVIWGGLASHRGCHIHEVVKRFDPELLLLEKSAAGSEAYLSRFIDYWNGPGAWDAMSATAKKPVIAGGEKIAAEVYEVVTDSTPHTDYLTLEQPILILHGTVSPPEVLEMKDILRAQLPNVRTACIPGGHMNPVRNPIPVNAHFELFLKQWRQRIPQRDRL